MVVDVFVQNPQRVTSTNMRKNMYVVTPRCAAAAAVVSAVVFRRPTKEYTHPYSMMHRRLPTAGIEVAPHYHLLIVRRYTPKSTDRCIDYEYVVGSTPIVLPLPIVKWFSREARFFFF